MTVDYNLVILGGSPAARYAADLARRYRARVALIEPTHSPHRIGDIETEATAARALQQAVEQRIQCDRPVPWDPRQPDKQRLNIPDISPFSAVLAPAGSLHWSGLQRWIRQVLARQAEWRSPSVLAMQGIDVVVGQAEFCRRPQFGVVVNGRVLRSRAYLIIPGSTPAIPALPGLQEVPYLTLDAWLNKDDLALTGQSIIIGGTARSLELAQTLARAGGRVTLLVDRPTLLPHEDPDVAHLMLAMLEATGVEVVTQTPVAQVKRIDGQIWVQAGDRAIATDHLILAAGRQPQLSGLNLDAAGLPLTHGHLAVNAKLRTAHPQIYACGEAIAPDRSVNLAQYEAAIAVKNALFLSTRRVQPLAIPRVIHTAPPLARVGLTEPQARRHYGHAITVLRQDFKHTDKGQLTDQTSGFCKIIARHHGQILGAHVIGADADELIGAIALAMQQRRTIAQLTHLDPPKLTYGTLLNSMRLDWETERLAHNRLRANLIELLMNWRLDS